MKKTNFFAIAAAVLILGLAGCTKEGGVPQPKIDATKGGLSLTIKIPNAVKASDTRATQDASIAENTINTVTVFIFDDTGVAAATGGATTLPISSFDQNTSGVWELKVGSYIPTTAGPKRVYVGINLPATAQGPFASQAGLFAKIADLIDIDNSSAIGFSMFSTAVAPVNLGPLDPANVAGTAGVVNVNVERIVAKVVTTQSASGNDLVADWGNGVTITYNIKDFLVFNDGITSYVAPNKPAGGYPVTTQNRNNFATSVGKAAKVIASTAPNTQIYKAGLDGFYVAENAPGLGAALSTFGAVTYVYVATFVTVSHAAEVNAAGQIIYTGVSGGYGKGSGAAGNDVYMIVDKATGENYVTNDPTKADDVALRLNEINGTDVLPVGDPARSKIYTYKWGYVHFPVYVHSDYAAGVAGASKHDYKVLRNDYVHVDITGILMDKGFFPGYPGNPTDPTKPIDPTDPTDPNNPRPKDPDDPVDPEDAGLLVNVTVNPWEYRYTGVVLK